VTTIDELKTRLRKLREKYGVTQEEFAAYAGLDYKFYQYIESPRKKQIWFETIEKIARSYKMTPWQLLHPDYLDFAKSPKPTSGRPRALKL
jgi:transcriptional regulator with XRE-family HTH domain